MRAFVKMMMVFALIFLGQSAAYSQSNGATSPDTIAGEARSQQSAAAQAPPVTNGGFFQNLEGAARQLATRLDSSIGPQLAATGMGYASALIVPALGLAGSLALMYLMYEVLMLIGAKSGSMLTVLFDVGVPAVITALLITNYAANIALFNGLLDLFRNIAGNPTTAIMRFYGSVLTMISNAISTAFETFGANFSLSFDAIGAIFYSAVDILATIIFSLIILVIVFSSMAEVLGLLLLGPFLYAIGLAFGPLLLAGLVTPWTRDYVGKWVGFIVGSAVLTGVLAIVISIAATLFNSLGFNAYVSGQPNAATMAMVAVLLMAVNSLISQAPGIASALIPGSLGAKTGGGAQTTRDLQSKAKQSAMPATKMGGKGIMKIGSLAKAGYKKASGKP